MDILRLNLIYRYIFVSLLIIVSADNFWFSGNAAEEYEYIRYAFLILVPLFMFFKKRNYIDSKKNLLVFVTILLLFFSSLINDGKISGGAALVAVLIMGSYIIVSWIPFDEFFKYFSNLLLYATLFSFVVWLLAEQLNLLPLDGTISKGGGYVESFGFCNFFHKRNMFVFREPGVFQVYINFALLFEIIYLNGELKKSHLLIYIAGILSTMSSAGFAGLFLILLLLILMKKNGYNKIVLFLFLIAFVFAILTNAMYQQEVIAKFSSTDEASSAMSRTAAIIVPISILINSISNFLFGVGISGIEKSYPVFSRSAMGFDLDFWGNATNTFFIPAAIFGAWILILFLGGYYRLALKIIRVKGIRLFLVIIILLVLFSNEGMHYSIFPYLLVMYGINKNDLFILRSEK